MTAVGAACLTAESVSVTLGQRRVVDSVSFTLSPGELVAVIGANGAGKSTLLKTLAGLIVPENGRVMLDGADLGALPRRVLARRLAYLPQDRTVHWPLAAERVVALGRLPHRAFSAGESAADLAAIRAAMERLDVIQFAQRPIATLSGGERARVLVARALAQGAQFLIADEPTAGLDPAHSLLMFVEFKRLAAEGCAIITALHDIALAARYATRVIVMRQGRAITVGEPAQVLSSDTFAQAFGVDAIIAEASGIPVFVPRAPLT